jgi:glycerol transport system ATP-binding protein
MARVHLDAIAHSYRARPASDADLAVKPLDFVWEDGGAYALLGPSGCGKTSLLNIISGLVRPTRGRVVVDGRDVTALPTAARNIAQVFQFPVVYDTMTVFENLAFPLRNRKVAPARVRERVADVAAMLELEPLLRRRAAGLTADQKQKISLGRGLVRDDVAAILFDEPLTVIDPHLKWLLRRKLKEVQERFRRTLIYVTHDQNEALTFADRVVVMLDGRVMQAGTPQELFERPAHRFVGWFIGSPGMNFLPIEPQDGGTLLIAGTRQRVPLPVPLVAADGGLELGIRPEFVEVLPPDQPGAEARVEDVQDLGVFRLAKVRLGPHLILAKVGSGRPIPADACRIDMGRDRARLYAAGRLVA